MARTGPAAGRMTRRALIARGGVAVVGLGAVGWAPWAYGSVLSLRLYITDGALRTVDGTRVYVRTFSLAPDRVSLPGPLILVVEGEDLELSITNTLSEAHSFAVAGVVDSGPVAPGATTVVRVVAPRAGTYLYADSLDAPASRLLGLHGALVTMPADGASAPYRGGPAFVRQYVWVLGDLDPRAAESARAGRPVDPLSFEPRYFTLNGRSAPDSLHDPGTVPRGRVGERALIRMLNAGVAYHSIHFHGEHVFVLTHNARVLDQAMRKDTILIAPGDTKDLLHPFGRPADAFPPVSRSHFPVHCHAEMSQTAGGGLYPCGMVTDWILEGDQA
jgi:FtsP/CotA-like multicopper oxidase with cupredoxin domain